MRPVGDCVIIFLVRAIRSKHSTVPNRSVLFLTHRIPYPPNKGDKIRSFHILRWLSENHDVTLGTFVDDDKDWAHMDHLGAWASRCFARPAARGFTKIRRLLSAFFRSQPLSTSLYADSHFQAWVDEQIRANPSTTILLFSSAMGQFVNRHGTTKLVTDFVDVDSEKWAQYAERKRWPLSWVYRREARLLQEHDLALAARSSTSTFVSAHETKVFAALAPTATNRLLAVRNGVDTDHFDPDVNRDLPLPEGKFNIVFTGAMDYWPNVDAVSWFCEEVLPKLSAEGNEAHFTIVGSRPTPAVARLASQHVTVTGFVDDVRPYLAHSDVVIAPLRIARGIQNKVLEAMAMGKTVIATSAAAEGIDAVDGQHLHIADTPEMFLDRLRTAHDSPAAPRLGREARSYVIANFSWPACLAPLGRALESADAG